MFPTGHRPLPSILLLLALVALAASCGRTSNDEGQAPSQSGGALPTAGSTAGAAGGQQGGSTMAKGGAESSVSSAGAPEVTDPSGTSRPCEEGDVPDAPCEDSRCWGTRCGVRFDLICKDGVWSSADSPLAWELVCPVSDEAIYDVRDIKMGACCGELLAKNDVHTEPPSCNLCPEAAPNDGSPCSLPSDCAPAIIDCFYKCCCYGTTTWAQCDGERWHVATNCSSK